jgi:hypothetical protein
MCSQNLSWSELISVQETVSYKPALSASGKLLPGRTNFEQTANVIALGGGWQKIKTGIEEATVERFKLNAARGRDGFERVLALSREAFAEQRRQQQGLKA